MISSESKHLKMVSVGIDAGMDYTKVVVLKEERDFEWIITPGGRESAVQIAGQALSKVVQKSGISNKDIDIVIATGAGSEYITFAHQKLPEFLCLAKGIDFLLPSTRTLLDLGARKTLAIKCCGGQTKKVAVSSKCAAGTGSYLKMVANILNIDTNQMSDMYFKSKNDLEIQATCAVFAESEIISLIHDGANPTDLVRGIFRGIAGRIYPQLLDIGVEKDVVTVGGFARNKALVTALEELMGFEIIIPENSEIIGALGAAILGQENRRKLL